MKDNNISKRNNVETHKYTSLYRKHGLNDLKKASLMDRIDSKFVADISVLGCILEACKNDYTILDIQDTSIFKYENTYYDTLNYDLYRMHHNGKLNRYKIRQRHYSDTDQTYFEIKKKTNKKKPIRQE